MKTSFCVFALVASCCATAVLAQDTAPWNQAPNPPAIAAAGGPAQPTAQSTSTPDLAARLNQLESETQALRAEVKRLQDQPVRLPEVNATPSAAASAPPAVPEQSGDYFTLDELRGEMKKLAWKKGDYSITPYGILWGNSVYSTERTYPGSYTMYVHSASSHPESEFIIDGRNSRLGFDIGGPELFCCLKTGGKIEIDFQQNAILNSAGSPSTENKASVLLRHAYAEAKNDDCRLLIGQTWDIISPLNPGMLLYSIGWDAGNIGYRRAQVRGERFLALSDTSLITTQLSINQQVWEDAYSSDIKGETSNWPILEGRTAWTIGERGPGCLPITVGVSGHIGEEQFDYLTSKNNRRRTWSGNIDFRMPITERLGFQAECFTGENLGAFLGGIGQGIDPTEFNTIYASGGWFEVWYFWAPCLHTHIGYSVDDPRDSDLHTATDRKYNQLYYGNIIYDVNKSFQIGVEVSSWKTLYEGLRPGESVRSEFVVKYGF